MIQWMLAIWSLVPLPFLNPGWPSGSSWSTYCWSLAWRILSINLLTCEMSSIVQLFEHSSALYFFGTGMKTGLFQSCGHCCVFQICWHIEWSILIASSSRIWNKSARIPSLPLALLAVMLPKAHLTLHSRMSGSKKITKVERNPICVGAKSFQSCLTLCNPMGCSLPGSSVHGILLAGTL